MRENGEEWKEVASVADSLAYTVKNLIHGTEYQFRVRAENVHGYSAPSQPTGDIVLTKQIDDEMPERVDNVPEIKSGGDFRTRFEVYEELGKGRFGIVHRVKEKESGAILAAKIIKCIKAVDRKKVEEEIGIMKSLQHPKLLQLSASFESQKEIIMVME
jgi:serine/threonine protein kinase